MPDLDARMRDASAKLVALDYLGCERVCLEALAVARSRGDWAYYARVVLPLQEARRQRRMIAADAAVRLGSAEGFAGLPAGCVCLTRPDDAARAAALLEDARVTRRHVEILWADNDMDADRWTLRTFVGPDVACEVPAPPPALRGRTLGPAQAEAAVGPSPAHWFISASEALGDAALAKVTAEEGTVRRVEQLEAMIGGCGDHEILHQRLADAARALVYAAA